MHIIKIAYMWSMFYNFVHALCVPKMLNYKRAYNDIYVTYAVSPFPKAN